ncbi:putative NADPH-dependent methylglyoxal reductase GRP2 [Madurella mycetomatis]|uniref:Putative NADPH-dependent methylglyoxal reductase GRP2 n=1 Tax=Madurella mycetomatis TaxID=100816 RepID=A0A175VYM7_9PEZI|nr:putative NADPH-dependent methylglyoxal reductase GRP2 [Madurella mycetomatis]KXX79636.1 putative NADPH-dependent methylglyoxal reductase GRP2 [Madurella mycetomatis]
MTLVEISAPLNKGKVLLTGGTGFVASHVLDCLLEHGFEVVVTARSEDKGQRIVQSIDEAMRKRVSYVVVEDVAKEGAFDEAVKSDPPLDYVVHTASPYQFYFDDPVKDCLDPAIKGTTGILKSVKAYAPGVKRVVITSSSAAVLSPPNHPTKVYNESFWCDLTWEQAMDPRHAYRASKKFAEKAAWSFIDTERPGFDLATINNTYTFGPIPRTLASLDKLNTSNQRIRDLVLGRMRESIEPTAPVFTFVDVRDVALAHVRALMVPEAGGKRFYVVGGFFSNPRLAGIIRETYPQLEDKLPPADVKDDFPDDHWAFDNSRSKKLLGLEYTSLEKSVVDTVESILRFEGK